MLSVGLVLVVALAFFFAGDFVGYRIVSFGLLTTVAVLALLVDIAQVLTAAALSALIWNFFFIPPVFTFHISNPEDLFMFFSFFILASVHAVLTRKIKKAQAKAQEVERNQLMLEMYDTFLNSLSHELKTPIATVIGTSDVLINSFSQLSSSEQLQLIQEMQRAGLRLNLQVENVLAMSRLESNAFALHKEYFDLRESVFQIIRQECNEEQQKRMVVQLAENFPMVRFDFRVLQWTLQNLIRNALNYSEGPITIQLFQKSNQLVILVSDKGAGIPLVYQSLLFDKFYRVPHTGSSGSGLGLSLVKGFAHLHGGEIHLLSSNEKGTVFQLTLEVEYSFLQ